MVFFQPKKNLDYKTFIYKKISLHGILNIVYRSILYICSLFVIILTVAILYILLVNSLPLLQRDGLTNILQDKWKALPPDQVFGFLYFIEGTVITSFYALIIAVPLSIGISLYISQYISNFRIRNTLKFVIELIAAIPSVLIGFWGIYTLGPALKEFHLIFTIPYINSFNISFSLVDTLSILPLPLLNQPLISSANFSVFTATIALVIMITPIIVSITVSIMNEVPAIQKEAAYALGATPWEMARMTVIPLSFRGIVGAVSIGLGRALGETMAVTMLIGNDYSHTLDSLFGTGSSITSIIASSYSENSIDPLARAAFIELALILMIISLIVNLFAKILVNRSVSKGKQ